MKKQFTEDYTAWTKGYHEGLKDRKNKLVKIMKSEGLIKNGRGDCFIHISVERLDELIDKLDEEQTMAAGEGVEHDEIVE